MRKLQHKTGYSLVEVLVSIAVLLIAIVGPMTIAAQGIKSARFALEQNSAFFLAQEGVEAIFAIRSDAALTEIDGGADAWTWLDNLDDYCGTNTLINPTDSCSFGIDFEDDDLLGTGIVDCNSDTENCLLYKEESGNRGVYTHTDNGSTPIYKRVVTVEITEAYAAKVTSVVTWESSVFRGQTQSVELTSQLFDLIL